MSNNHERSDREVLEDLQKRLERMIESGPGDRPDKTEWTPHEKKILKNMVQGVIFAKKLGRVGLYLLLTLGLIASNLQAIKEFFS
jgi:hypothetical protein